MCQELIVIHNSINSYFIQKPNQNKQTNKNQTAPKTWLSKLGNVTTVTTIGKSCCHNNTSVIRQKLEKM